jgi:hypothetical protein
MTGEELGWWLIIVLYYLVYYVIPVLVALVCLAIVLALGRGYKIAITRPGGRDEM